jgi:UDP-N-acetylglucosamine pyrophosphorylase
MHYRPKQPPSVDHAILQHMVDSQAEFLMEVTDKTKADIKVTT